MVFLHTGVSAAFDEDLDSASRERSDCAPLAWKTAERRGWEEEQQRELKSAEREPLFLSRKPAILYVTYKGGSCEVSGL